MRDAPEPLARALTVHEFARRFRIGEDKTRALIRSGELRAVNVALSLLSKPRFVIPPEAVAEFERKRSAAPPPKQVRRRRKPDLIDFFPD